MCPIWLDPESNSPYKFYQFWLNADDAGVEGYLKVFTELDKPKVEQVMHDFNENRANRVAQKTLAFEVTKLVHGEDQAHRQVHIAETLFGGGDHSKLTTEDYEVLSKELPTVEINEYDEIASVMVDGGLASSNTEARRFLSEGAVCIDGERVEPGTKWGRIFVKEHPRYGTIRRGRNTYMLVRVR